MKASPSIYRQAAMSLDSQRRGFSCDAIQDVIGNVQDEKTWQRFKFYRSCYAAAFMPNLSECAAYDCSTFSWFGYAQESEECADENLISRNTDTRVLALLFAAEMARTGDLTP